MAQLWKTTVLNAGLFKYAPSVAPWVRAAVRMRFGNTEVFHCPLCSVACEGWRCHILHACEKLVVALQEAFHALVFSAARADGPVPKHSTTAATPERPKGSLHVSLHSETASTRRLASIRDRAAIIPCSKMVATSCPAARG